VNIEQTLKERGTTHGDYTETAEFCQIIKSLMRRSRAWQQMTPWMQESLDMIAHKMARICCGDPFILDHWTDIGGYNKLTHDRINAPPVPTVNTLEKRY
jgi:hypothetical protein